MTAAIAVPKEKAVPRSILAEAIAMQSAQLTIQEIPVDLIVRSETNRQPELDDDFVESIRRGVDSPVLVRPIKATQEHVEQWRRIDSPPIVIGQTIYKLVYGERRWSASKEAGKKTIPGIVRELTDTQALEIQVRENEQRQDYNAMDRAAAYAHLREQYMLDHKSEKGFTEEKCCALIAETCKNDKIKGRTVQQIIALQKLTPDCQAALRKGEMEQSHAYEFCRLSVEDQAEQLLWLRQQTHHSQGDIPSVRRLKLEIRNMEIRAEDRRRQEKLFKEGPGASAKLTFDGKTIDLAPGPLPGSVRAALCKTWPNLTTAHFLNDGRVQLAQGLAGKPHYHTVGLIQNLLSGKITAADLSAETSTSIAPPQTSATPKPLSEAQIKKNQAAVQKEIQQNLKAQRDSQQRAKIQEAYSELLFAALAKKGCINSRLLTHVVPNLLFEVWENEWPIELSRRSLSAARRNQWATSFGQQVLGWPAPKGGEYQPGGYSYSEVREYCTKYTRKFTPGVLAALLIALFADDNEQLARYFGVDHKKIRQKATAQVKQEAAAAKKKAKSQGPKAGVTP